MELQLNRIKESPRLSKMVERNPIIKENLEDLESRLSVLTEDYVCTKQEEQLLSQLNKLINSEIANESLWERLLTKIKTQGQFNDDNIPTRVKNGIDSATEILTRFLDSTPSLQENKRVKGSIITSKYLWTCLMGIFAVLSIIENSSRATRLSAVESPNVLLVVCSTFALVCSGFVLLMIIIGLAKREINEIFVFACLFTFMSFSTYSLILESLAMFVYMLGKRHREQRNSYPEVKLNELTTYLFLERIPEPLFNTELPNEYWEEMYFLASLIEDRDSKQVEREADSLLNTIKEHATKIEAYQSVKSTVR